MRFNQLSREEQDEIVRRDPSFGRIICRCETVTEGEIVDAIRRGARTLDGIKFRARGAARAAARAVLPTLNYGDFSQRTEYSAGGSNQARGGRQ